jgi:hypothetical protein
VVEVRKENKREEGKDSKPEEKGRATDPEFILRLQRDLWGKVLPKGGTRGMATDTWRSWKS